MGDEKFERKLIAYVDILGFETLINESNKSQLDNIVKKIKSMQALVTLESFVRIELVDDENDNSSRDISADEQSYPLCEISTISDCMLITAPVTSEGATQLFNYLFELYRMAINEREGFSLVLRGGMVIGDILHNGNLIIGTGYNKAVRLEKQAVNPIIVLDENFIEEKEIETVIENYKNLYLKFDSKNMCWYFSPLTKTFKEGKDLLSLIKANDNSQCQIKPRNKFRVQLLRWRDMIQGELLKHKNNSSIYDKWLFLALEFNLGLREIEDRDTLKINGIEEIRIKRISKFYAWWKRLSLWV